MSGGPRDVGQVVHRWGFKIAGDPGESIDTFLERVEESWTFTKLTEGEIAHYRNCLSSSLPYAIYLRLSPVRLVRVQDKEKERESAVVR